MKALHIVLKIAERCNLACSYCYFFEGGDETYKKHPPVIKSLVVEQVGNFINTAVKDFQIEKVVITLHGGEPLLVKKAFFLYIVSYFKRCIVNASCDFCLQTNGILLDKEWIEIFEKYNISVGISLDGPADYNDLYRLDKKQQGSHHKIINKLHLLDKNKYSCLAVVNKDFDAKRVYSYLVNELRFNNIDYLLPDIKYDDNEVDIEKYGEFLCNLFDVWTTHNNPNVNVRICTAVIRSMLGLQEDLSETTTNPNVFTQIAIGSDGTIYFDDILRGVGITHKYNVFNISLQDYLVSDEFTYILSESISLPKECIKCCWQKICRGGKMVNRYSSNNGFNNPSVLCESLKVFYIHVFNYLIDHGITLEKIKKNLTYNC